MLKGVYVAASSEEMVRAKKWMDALREKGITVTSHWVEVIQNESKGVANPRDASLEDRQKWSLEDIQRSCKSAVFWMLMPNGPHSFGATFEFAFFTALADQEKQAAIVSGDFMRSIFTSFATCFKTDEEAFQEILAWWNAVEVTKPDPAKNENAAQPEG